MCRELFVCVEDYVYEGRKNGNLAIGGVGDA